MHCQQASQLFDAYLDGELSESLRLELDAHRVRCTECRRALALMEVAGHFVASDKDPQPLRAGFTDRLMACMDQPERHWHVRLRRTLYIGGPLAAAAAIVLAFAGVFDNSTSMKLGEKVGIEDVRQNLEEVERLDKAAGAQGGGASGDAANNETDWAQEAELMIDAKRQSVESLQEHFDESVLQLLEILENAEQSESSDPSQASTDESDAGLGSDGP